MSAPRVLVHGAGVIGSLYAARFARAGSDVTVVARGERLRALRERGLHLVHALLGEEERAEVTVTDRAVPGASYELILVVVRSDLIAGALLDVARCEAGAIAAIGNNVEGHADQAALAGEGRLVLGFGSYGGYRREDGAIVYVDGRTPEKALRLRGTTLGVVSPAASGALDRARAQFDRAGLPVTTSPDIVAWLQYHAALVLPLAGAIYATGGDQARLARSRDAIVLGVRGCKELFRALRQAGLRARPRALGVLRAMPEPYLVHLLGRTLPTEGARVAMFGHANAPGGRDELTKMARALDGLARGTDVPLPCWRRLLPYFPPDHGQPLVPDGARALRFHPW